MLAVFSISFVSCSDDENNIIYPTEEQKRPQTINEAIGILTYDAKRNDWIIQPERMSIETSIYMIIENIKEEYKVHEGKKVKFSGVVIDLYYKKDDNFSDFGYKEVYQSLDLSSLELYTESRVLSNENEFYCGTISQEPPLWYFTKTDDIMYWSNSYTFNVFTHIIRNSAGERDIDKEEVVDNIINRLNNYYAETSISFVSIGSEYIDSDLYSSITENSSVIFGVNPHSNAIDIYIFEGDKLGTLLGKADGIISTACLLKNENEIDEFTLPHEVGHCLGLYHTHHGTATNTYKEGGDAELVDGSNSDIAGDFITDTPADPCEWLGGYYIGIGTDANGDIYSPDPLNIMSYSFHYNINKFTQKQIERIHQTISKTSSLQAACNSTNKKIVGPDYITTQGNYSIDVPSGYIVDWEISCYTYTDKTSAPAVTTHNINNSSTITLINPNPDAYSQRFELKATITTPSKGYKFYLTKRVYHVLYSSKTGSLTWGSESKMGNYLGAIDLTTPNRSSPIKVYQGGILTFNYSDICGANSYDDFTVFDFNVYSPSSISKVSNSNHAFQCATHASTTNSTNLMLSFTYSGSSTFMQIPLQILQTSLGTLNTDSLELEEPYMKDELLIKEL